MSSLQVLPVSKVLDVSRANPPMLEGHLRLGGTNPQGRSIGFTSLYMLRDGVPCIPVMGEFHFSRYAHSYWEDELLKMKAGGVEIVAAYVFWIHVEEDEGVFDWSGNNHLRRFVELCGRHGMDILVRIGPFAHGECRNGGIPDWLYGLPFAVRSNDERYLAYVRRFYGEIAAQLQGLLFKDGGPVIGVQLENEYMHAGAPWETTYRQGTEYVPGGSDGAAHIAALKRLALDAGLEVPIYSCTAWLHSPIVEDEILPMQGGYVFTPWNPDPSFRQPPTREFLFRDRRLHPVSNGEPTYDASRYPYVCCEIGGGTQDTYYHRNVMTPEAVEAYALMHLAGGANLLGYYMYHGGSNPVGSHGYLNEYTVPRISYDFQAPIGEYGQIKDSYRSLRLLHLFLRDFGDLLAPMTVVLPDDAAAITPENTTDVRCAARAKDGAGFLFLNNYQDHVEMRDIDGLRFRLTMPDGDLCIPQSSSLTLQKDVSAVLPFGLCLSGIRLRYATTQLLTRVETEEATTYVFFAPRGMASEYALDASTCRPISVSRGEARESDGCLYIRVTPGMNSVVTLRNEQGETVRLITLTREQAERSTKQVLWGRERLVISEATVVAAGEECYLYSRESAFSLLIYPPPAGRLTNASAEPDASADGLFARYTVRTEAISPNVIVEPISPGKAVVRVPSGVLDGVDNAYLRVRYVGDIGNCFIDGRLVADNFNNGLPWEIGLKQIMQGGGEAELFILITPIRASSGARSYLPTGMAFAPDAAEAGIAEIQSITLVPEYRLALLCE